MNATRLFSAALMLAVTSAAFSQTSSEYVEFSGSVPTKARAEVTMGLTRAQAGGELARKGEFGEVAPATSTLSRAQVRHELAKAYYAGDMHRNTEWVEHTNIVSTRTREEVRNEVLQAVKPRHPGSDR